MNRVTLLTVSLSVIFCTISCNEKNDESFLNAFSPITVTTQVGPHVKAGYEGVTTLPKGFQMRINTPAFDDWMTQDPNGSNSYVFPKGPAPVWGNIDISQVTIKALTVPTAGNISPDGIINVSVLEDQTDPANVMESDLLGAATHDGIVINNNNINITFNHLMSKLLVRYSVEGASQENIPITMTLKNVCVNSEFDFGKMKFRYQTDLPSSGNDYSEISMFHNSDQTFEAIFCPHLPLEDMSNIENGLHLSIEINGKTLLCPVALEYSDGFAGGKCYMMNVIISDYSAESPGVTVEPWDTSHESSEVEGERVLWIGTSIPAGDHQRGYISYPEKVDEAMNCTVVNNARGGSLVVKHDNANWVTNGMITWNLSNLHLHAGGLSQKITEVRDTYYDTFAGLTTDTNLIEQVIADAEALSYESLIIPYIDGTLDKCTTVIIDHGYNDLASMILEANGLDLFYNSPIDMNGKHMYVRGHHYLKKLANREIDYANDIPEDYMTDYTELLGLLPELRQLGNYIVGMSRIIQEIRNVDPTIKIIIGNYFTVNNPMVSMMYKSYESVGWDDYNQLTSLICHYNETVASLWGVKIVNVQDYLWLDDESFKRFCIKEYVDGQEFYVHPWTEEAVNAIADIYIRELDGVIGSRIK